MASTTAAILRRLNRLVKTLQDQGDLSNALFVVEAIERLTELGGSARDLARTRRQVIAVKAKLKKGKS